MTISLEIMVPRMNAGRSRNSIGEMRIFHHSIPTPQLFFVKAVCRWRCQIRIHFTDRHLLDPSLGSRSITPAVCLYSSTPRYAEVAELYADSTRSTPIVPLQSICCDDQYCNLWLNLFHRLPRQSERSHAAVHEGHSIPHAVSVCGSIAVPNNPLYQYHYFGLYLCFKGAQAAMILP